MKRTLILAAVLGIFAPVALVGCGEETKTEKTEKVSTPGGSDTKTVTEKETKTGDQKDNK